MTDMLIEGYAALFGVADLSGDVIRAGAFARSLQGGAGRPMLFQHGQGKIAGRWSRIIEDQRGLYVRGLIEDETAWGKAAMTLALGGRLDGLSIGFHARRWRPRSDGGRDLLEVDLVEISLVASPMAQGARFVVMADQLLAA